MKIKEASLSLKSIRRQIQKYKEDRGGKYNKIDAWDSCWKDIYALSDAICDRVLKENQFREVKKVAIHMEARSRRAIHHLFLDCDILNNI